MRENSLSDELHTAMVGLRRSNNLHMEHANASRVNREHSTELLQDPKRAIFRDESIAIALIVAILTFTTTTRTPQLTTLHPPL
jgi:hypothetical protein